MGWTTSASRIFAFYALDIRFFAFPALCDAYATYATYALITHIHAPQAPQARLFPRLMQHIHAILASPVIYCHHEFASLHHLEVALSLDTAFAHFRFSSANVPALRAPIAPSSRAIDTSLSHCCSRLHIIQAVVTITSQSFYCVCTHQSRFTQSAILPRFHAPMAPYALRLRLFRA
ncbi:hypothetical protein P692DRAFT_20881675 [Suillus brevipes Sb2]|nr:hypothetical protein P692DRAFT_20881675 [Suillus brevipes Sb2]